jgi:hypothetical protein
MTDSPQPHTPKKQRGRACKSAPFVSRRPWAGFTAHDKPRLEPLPVCPSARCRRAKACISALDNLYCRRTHHSLHEQRTIHRVSPLQRELATVPEVIDGDDLSARMERIAALAEIRRAHEADMLAQWKAGALDTLYGKHCRNGVVMTPPQKAYVELPPKRPQNRDGQHRPRHL